ncbi:MAG: T9SS type A sorting domain-containing protein [Saprospiraceae bacterium]|nr:T9SS type A sorting domain-containing protein [Saprospiraceae bacterium]
MNRKFTLLILLAFVAFFSLDAQAVRKVLIEEYTSATCPPCASTNPIFDPFLESRGPNVIALKYQSYIPTTGDPMYGHNIPESQARHQFYGINSAPSCRLDGTIPHNGHPINLVINSAPLDSRMAVTSPIELNVNHEVTLDAGKDSMSINVDIKNVSSVDFTGTNYVLHTVITESKIRFPRQAATNGEIEFSHVMRKMIPNQSGTRLTTAITPGETKSFSFRVPVPSYIYSVNELSVVAFVQNAVVSGAGAREVFQAAYSAPKQAQGGYFDINLISGTMKNRVDQCDNSVSYDLEFENVSTDSTPITSIDFVQLNSGVARPRINWSGSLLPGDKASHTFNNLPLNLGSATFNIYIDRINGGAIRDRNVVNNFEDQLRLLTFPNATNGNTLNEGFETGSGTTPVAKTYVQTNGLRIFRASAAQGNNFPHMMGGFGQSAWNMFFAFSDAGSGGLVASLYFDKIDLSQGINTEASWNYAYAVKDANSNDKMELLISTDCGDTWTTVYSDFGSSMASVPVVDVVNSHIPGFWLPLPDQWKAQKVDLSAFDGTPEILVQFRGTGGNGWAYFLDDVNIKNGTSGTQDPGIVQSMKVFPNPVSDRINMDVRMEESAKADIRLFDMQGRFVSQLANGQSLQAGLNNLSYAVDLESGVYSVEVRTAKGLQTQKITVF